MEFNPRVAGSGQPVRQDGERPLEAARQSQENSPTGLSNRSSRAASPVRRTSLPAADDDRTTAPAAARESSAATSFAGRLRHWLSAHASSSQTANEPSFDTYSSQGAPEGAATEHEDWGAGGWGDNAGDDDAGDDNGWSLDTEAREHAWTGDWLSDDGDDAINETSPLVRSVAPSRSSRESSSASSDHTVADSRLEVGLNLAPLYRRIKQALPDGFTVSPPTRPNCWLPDAAQQRPERSARGCIDLIQGATRQCKAALGLKEVDGALAEQLEGVSQQLSQLLSHRPPVRIPDQLAASCAKLNEALVRVRRLPGNDPMASAALAACEEKLRAVVLDAVGQASLQGKPLVAFLERAFSGDPAGLLGCTLELPSVRQGQMFDGSRTLRSALQMSVGVRARFLRKMSALNLKSDALPLPQAVTGLTHAAIHATSGKVKERALHRLERRFDGPSTPSSTPLKRFVQAVAKKKPPEVSLPELRAVAVPILAKGVPFLGSHAERGGKFLGDQCLFFSHRDKARTLASMLVVRAALDQGGADSTNASGIASTAWLDRMIDSLGEHMPEAFAQVEDDRIAQAMVGWLCNYLKEARAPALRLREMARGLHDMATDLPPGTRRDMLLRAMLDTKASLPPDHRGHLLVNSALRVAGQEWAAQMGQPDLLDVIKKQDLELYPRFLASGHAFKKHVQGHGNPDGREFDEVLGTSSSKEERRHAFQEHLRNVMTSPTDLFVDRASTLHFYDQQTYTTIVANPRHTEGGTAFTIDRSKFLWRRENTNAIRLPNDCYANLGEGDAPSGSGGGGQSTSDEILPDPRSSR